MSSSTTWKESSNEETQEFDTYYKEEKDALRRALSKIFRKSMTERSQLTLQECKNIDGKKILDIGCGTGHIAIQLAKRGAQVVGMDPLQNSIDIAKSIVEKESLSDKCTFIRDNFTNHTFDEKFDISLALGFFDYTKDSAFYVKRMKSVTTEKCIMSFPAKFAFQVPLRMIWLHSRKCPVYFYTKKELKRLFSSSFTHYKIKNISAGYFCVASISGKHDHINTS